VEQNPEDGLAVGATGERGHKGMQFLSAGRGNRQVVDGKSRFPEKEKSTERFEGAAGLLAELPKGRGPKERKNGQTAGAKEAVCNDQRRTPKRRRESWTPDGRCPGKNLSR